MMAAIFQIFEKGKIIKQTKPCFWQRLDTQRAEPAQG